MTPKLTSPQWQPRTKRTIALVSLAFVVALMWFLRSIFPIIIVSALLAYLLNPLVTFLANRVLILPFFGNGPKRGWAAVLSFIITIFGLTTVLLFLVPAFTQQIEEFGANIPQLIEDVEIELERVLSEPLVFNGEPILFEGEPLIPLERLAEATGNNMNDIIQFDDLDLTVAAETIFGSVGSLSGPAFSFLGGAFNTLVNVTFLLMLTFYLLKDGAIFLERFVALAPNDYQGDSRRLLHSLGGVWNAYIRGQLILCAVIGVAVYVAALALGLPNAAILGLIAGILEFIPNIGPFIALIPAAILALVSESSTLPFLSGVPFMFTVIVVWTVIQNIEAVFLVPRIMGDSLDLHPYIVIIAVLGGAALAGALGVILAAPFVASARIVARYIYGKLTDTAPFNEPAEKQTASPTFLGKIIVQFYRLFTSLIRVLQHYINRIRKDTSQETDHAQRE